MKFCKAWVSEKRHGEQVLRALIGFVLAGFVVAAVACSSRRDLGFDVVAVPSAAYLAVATNEAGAPMVDGGTREGGAVSVASTKCEKAPDDDDFEADEEIAVCPTENADGWPLERKVTTRHREDREEDVCCFKRPTTPRAPPVD